MKKIITNLTRIFRPQKQGGELYGRNGFNDLDRIEIHRNDDNLQQHIFFEAFSKTKPYAKGAPCLLTFNLDDAREFHKTLGQVLNPTEKDLEQNDN
jgi:hypothetical protein